MKKTIKKILLFITNPRLLLCFAMAWMLTNGWSYVFFALGTWLDIGWMAAMGGAYLAFLWLPVSPEKLMTFTIAIVLLRWLFPEDKKTLAVLREMYAKTKAAIARRKENR